MNLRHIALGVLPLAALALGAPTAAGQTDEKDAFAFAFTTSKAKRPAGYAIAAVFPKQRIIEQITITFPVGTKFDTNAVAQCDQNATTADGANLSEVCPAGSKIGTGEGTAYLGDNPDPVTFDLGLYNTKSGGVLDIMLNGRTAFSSPFRYRGRKQDISLSLTPSLNARIVAFELDVKRAGTARKPLLRTPATCPKSRKLPGAITAFEHKAGSVTTRATTTCRK